MESVERTEGSQESGLAAPTFSIDSALEPWLGNCGRIVQRWPRERGAGCVRLIAEVGGRRAFFKQAKTRRAADGLVRAMRVYEEVRHRLLPPLWGWWSATDGPMLVFECVEGSSLYDPAQRERFRALPRRVALQALDDVFGLHAAIVDRGFVSCDFYDGSILYDFERGRPWVVDLDEYRRSPYRVTRARMPGSTRFMAPEESRRGARVDERTTVFHLGRLTQVLIVDSTPQMLEVAARATAPRPADRQQRVLEFLGAWRRAAADEETRLPRAASVVRGLPALAD